VLEWSDNAQAGRESTAGRMDDLGALASCVPHRFLINSRLGSSTQESFSVCDVRVRSRLEIGPIRPIESMPDMIMAHQARHLCERKQLILLTDRVSYEQRCSMRVVYRRQRRFLFRKLLIFAVLTQVFLLQNGHAVLN
jgi:hypothetical protein